MANNFFDFNDDSNDKPRKEKNKFPTAIWYVMAILILIGIQITFLWSNTTTELPYSQFRKELERGNVESVKISPTSNMGAHKGRAGVLQSAQFPNASTPSNQRILHHCPNDAGKQ
ncbi:MAG: ATP-dependent metallopeptidase FtsH/Yme1/Tma family protein [Chloroherpetonaceae bacterium]|nr:ATP-dependent metallopeptidase FtsH/Yme1/Tma family protein [Chloroherpetonaceae bacterium]